MLLLDYRDSPDTKSELSFRTRRNTMKNAGKMIVVLSVVVLLVAASAQAVVIDPEDDTRVYHGTPTGNEGATNNLTVKADSASLNDYKPYMRFDLSSFTPTITSASLDLIAQGEAMEANDVLTVNVYGLNDGTAGETTWTEGGITWNNAPGNVTTSDAGFVNSTLLGTFDVTDNGSIVGTTYSFSSAALITFLNADTNNKVTIMLSSAEGSGDDADANYVSFAGFEHATYDGPKLTVIPEPATMGLLGIGGLLALVRKNR